MKLIIGILTHNVFNYLRIDLLENTVKTAKEEFPDVIILDNGSTDGTTLLAKSIDPDCLIVPPREDGLPSPNSVGMNVLTEYMISVHGADIIVLSDDDMVWKSGSYSKLIKFWSKVPNDVVLLSGLLEPEWHWNTPRETIDCGGVRALVRDSASSAAWSFRANDWSKFGPLKEIRGQDYQTCVNLREKGFRVAQMDLADHAGWDFSTHGNKAIDFSKPLDRDKWGI
jgi:glycosyltransferase involved in cell wall biosynthesis